MDSALNDVVHRVTPSSNREKSEATLQRTAVISNP